jgi:hypothetical protein
VVAIFSIPAIKDWTSGKGEFFTLLLSCTFGMMLMAGANDLLMMYLSLEFVSITSYIMAGFLRKNRKSAEASLKYIIYGAAASGFMIYGMTFLYGLTGSLNVGAIGVRSPRIPAGDHDPDHERADHGGLGTRSRPCRSTCGAPTSTRARPRRSRRSSASARRRPVSRCSRGSSTSLPVGAGRGGVRVEARHRAPRRCSRWRWATSPRSTSRT